MKKKNKKVTSGSAIEMMRRVTTGIRSLIEYSMSAVFSTDTGEHYLYNSGSSREANNSELFSGRHLVLDATQELPIEVPHTLGANEITGSSWTKVVSSGVMDITNNTASSFSLDVTSLSTGTTDLSVYIPSTGDSSTETYLLEFYATINSGTVILNWTQIGSSIFNIDYVVVNGVNRIEIVNEGDDAYGNIRLYFDGTTNLFNVDITNITQKQITTPANSGILHFDPTAKEYTQIGADGVGSSVEEVTNGDFSDGDTNWTLQAGWSVVNNVLTRDGTNTTHAQYYDYSVFDSDRLYNINFDILSVVTAEVYFRGNYLGLYGQGSHSIIAQPGTSTLTSLRFAKGSVGVIEVDNVSVKEALPVSTTYTFTNQSVGEIAPTTKPFTTADIALMNADNQLLGQLALGSTTTGLSLTTADLYGYYPVSELSGKLAVDLTVPLGAEKVTTYNSMNNADEIATAVAGVGSAVQLDVTTVGTNQYRPKLIWDGVSVYTIGTFVITIDVEVFSGTFGSNGIQTATTDNIGADYHTPDVGVGVHQFAFIVSNTTTTNGLTSLYIDGRQLVSAKISLSSREATASEVSNYDATVRTNGDTSTYGMQLVGFKQDSLGLPTAVADAGTTQWTADGRTATTGWTVTAPFTVTEYVGGATQGFGSENYDGTYGTDSATVYTVTPITNGFKIICNGTGADATSALFLNELIPMTDAVQVLFDFTASIISGTPLLTGEYSNGARNDVSPQLPILNGSNSIYLKYANLAGRVLNLYFNGGSSFEVDITFSSVKQLTGADIYTFTSDGNRYKNTVADGTYTLPTGEWVLDNTAFDDVTPVTARGNTKLIPQVIIP